MRLLLLTSLNVTKNASENSNNSCKSFNVRPGADIAKRLCELNNKTRKMTPESFKKMIGSSYYGPVKVSSNDWTSTMAFHLTIALFCCKVRSKRLDHESSVEGNRRRSPVFLDLLQECFSRFLSTLHKNRAESRPLLYFLYDKKSLKFPTHSNFQNKLFFSERTKVSSSCSTLTLIIYRFSHG